MSAETTMVLALAVPLVGALLIVLTRFSPNLRESMTLAASVILFVLVASLFDDVFTGARPQVTLIEMLPGLSMAFKLEPLGMLFAGVASFL